MGETSRTINFKVLGPATVARPSQSGAIGQASYHLASPHPASHHPASHHPNDHQQENRVLPRPKAQEILGINSIPSISGKSAVFAPPSTLLGSVAQIEKVLDAL